MEPTINVQSLGGDSFMLGGEVYTLDELILLLQVGRANNIEVQLEGTLTEMAVLNEKMQEANDVLEELRVSKSALDGNNSQLSTDTIDFLEANDIQQGISKWDVNHQGQDWGLRLDEDGFDYMHNEEEYETTIENVKAFVSELNQLSQLTVLKLSSSLKARDEGYALASATIKDSSDARKEVIRAI